MKEKKCLKIQRNSNIMRFRMDLVKLVMDGIHQQQTGLLIRSKNFNEEKMQNSLSLKTRKRKHIHRFRSTFTLMKSTKEENFDFVGHQTSVGISMSSVYVHLFMLV